MYYNNYLIDFLVACDSKFSEKLETNEIWQFWVQDVFQEYKIYKFSELNKQGSEFLCDIAKQIAFKYHINLDKLEV